MDDKFAIYIIVVEDTEEADMAISALGVVTMERVTGGLPEQAAIEEARILASNA